MLCRRQATNEKVSRLLTPVSKHWNSLYYLIKRALILKDSLIKFSKSMQSTFLGEAHLSPKSPIENSVDAPL